jgi:hypothetical protein
MPTCGLIQVDSAWYLTHRKLEFCFLELSGISSFFKYLNKQLVESADVEPQEKESQLYMVILRNFGKVFLQLPEGSVYLLAK